MFQSKKPKSSRGVRHERKFCLCTDASLDMQCLRALDMQLPCVIAERAIHYGVVMDGWSFWPQPIKFLVDMLNCTHWLRMRATKHEIRHWLYLVLYHHTQMCNTNWTLTICETKKSTIMSVLHVPGKSRPSGWWMVWPLLNFALKTVVIFE